MPDRELLLERLERLAIVLDELMPQCAELVRDALALLKEQPEIVRCKDCKYYDHFNGCMSWHDVNSNNDNWFCADGERKKGR